MGNYEPLSVANGFLEMGFREGAAIDPMKIQKLTYFTHGYYLAASGQPLIRSGFEAWPFGPVNPEIYEAFKSNRGNPISDYGKIYSYNLAEEVPAAPPENDELYMNLRQSVWDMYGRWSSPRLSDATHKRGGAWDQTWSNSARRNTHINDALIRTEFLPLVNR